MSINSDDSTWVESLSEQLDIDSEQIPDSDPTPRMDYEGNGGMTHREGLPQVSPIIREELTEVVNEFIFGQYEMDEDFSEEYGIEYFAGGSFRTVYEFTEDTELPIMNPEDLVLKVVNIDAEVWTNKEEARIWNKFSGTELDDHLAPTIDIGPEGRWLLMKKVDCDPKIEYYQIEGVRERFQNAGWDYHDFQKRNCGFDEEDNLVLVDYGYDWSEAID